MRIKKFSDDLYEENAYLVIENDDVTLIDPGFNYNEIQRFLEESNLRISRILLTHGHIDHIGELDKFFNDEKSVRIYIHESDFEMLFDKYINCSYDFGMPKELPRNINVIKVKDGDVIDGFKFHSTPGHSKGSVIIEYKNQGESICFSGDTLFKGTVGRTDLYGGNQNELSRSLDWISTSFSNKTVFYPGHYSKTTLKEELENNPYMRRR